MNILFADIGSGEDYHFLCQFFNLPRHLLFWLRNIFQQLFKDQHYFFILNEKKIITAIHIRNLNTSYIQNLYFHININIEFEGDADQYECTMYVEHYNIDTSDDKRVVFSLLSRNNFAPPYIASFSEYVNELPYQCILFSRTKTPSNLLTNKIRNYQFMYNNMINHPEEEEIDDLDGGAIDPKNLISIKEIQEKTDAEMEAKTQEQEENEYKAEIFEEVENGLQTIKQQLIALLTFSADHHIILRGFYDLSYNSDFSSLYVNDISHMSMKMNNNWFWIDLFDLYLTQKEGVQILDDDYVIDKYIRILKEIFNELISKCSSTNVFHEMACENISLDNDEHKRMMFKLIYIYNNTLFKMNKR